MRSSTKVRTAALVSQIGEQAKRTASRSSPARIANTVTAGRYAQARISRPPRDARRRSVGMGDQRTPRVGYRAALASRELRAIVGGQLVSVAGTSIAAVALTILVYQRTASPLLSALAFALGSLPYLLGGVLLSGIVDRVRPRRLVVR